MPRAGPATGGSSAGTSTDASGRDHDGLPLDPDAGTGTTQRTPRPWAHRRLDLLGAVAAGGALGNVARYEVTRAFPVRPAAFPTATLLINTAGSFVLGAVLVVLIERLPPTRYARALVAVGLIGAFTTYSTFAVESAQLVADHRPARAATFVAASISGGLAATVLGIAAGRALPHRHPPAPRRPRERST